MRVHELAKSLGIESKDVLTRVSELGSFVRSASSVLDQELVDRIKKSFGDLGDRVQIEPRAQSDGWRSSPIRPPNNPQVLSSIARMCAAFPTMAAHQNALQALGSQIVYAGYCKNPNFSECAVVLVRFSGAIEAAFGLTREVLFFYSPHRDTQIRTYQAAREAILDVPRAVTPDIMFFWSGDNRLRAKLDDWSRGGFLAIPLAINDPDDPISFVELLRDYIFKRDLFYETTPVRGDRFFGRKTLLQGLRDDIRNQRVVGIYGLRKSGKTSVLAQLMATMSGPENIVLLQDLEVLPSPPIDPVPQLVAEIRTSLLVNLKERGHLTKPLADIGSQPELPAFKAGMTSLLRALSKKNVNIALMLDEIEYLTPSDVIDIREGPLPAIAQFLGTLRSLVQENSNFTFVLSGLTSAITESGRLYGRPNPLFSWAKAYFLSPLERLEADEMAVSIGARMGIRIHSRALEALYEASGGHAFMYRHLASHVVESLPINVFEREMTRPSVLGALQSWRNLIAGNVKEMIDHVRRYYPDEAALIDILRSDPESFGEFAQEEPLPLGHLLSLGLIRSVDREYELSPVLDLL